ncbi:MAG: M20/M25/M40 family metallo-hydrolase [archaeon]
MELLSDLLIDSYSGNYEAIIRVIAGFLRKNTDAYIEIQGRLDKGNILAKFGDPKLVINCHMDTVAPGDGWTLDPVGLTLRAGRAYGLGTADTKGNIYALLMAAASCVPKDVMLLFSYDEEAGITTGVSDFLEPSYAAGIKKAIICEPTRLQYVSRHKGYSAYEIKISGCSAHSSLAKKNVIVEAAKLIEKFQKAGFNVGTILGGTAANTVPSACTFTVSYRSYGPARDMVYDLAGNKAKVSCLTEKPPLISSTGPEADFWTEAALFQKKGISAQVFGAGDIDQAHAPDEYVEVSELKKARDAFVGMLT